MDSNVSDLFGLGRCGRLGSLDVHHDRQPHATTVKQYPEDDHPTTNTAFGYGPGMQCWFVSTDYHAKISNDAKPSTLSPDGPVALGDSLASGLVLECDGLVWQWEQCLGLSLDPRGPCQWTCCGVFSRVLAIVFVSLAKPE